MKDGRRGKERNEEWRKRDAEGRCKGRENEDRKDMTRVDEKMQTGGAERGRKRGIPDGEGDHLL